jgi:type IV fimbrial biogenesis protein FimT
MKRTSGFTIIEVVIVLLIVAVLATLAVPAMGDFIKNNRIRGQTYGLLGAIHLARTEAVKRKTHVVLCRSLNPAADPPACNTSTTAEHNQNWTPGWLVFAAGDTNATYEAANDTLLRTGPPAEQGVTIRTNGTSNRNLEYNPDGTTEETGGTAQFSVCDDRGGAFGRQISVPPHGRPTITAGEAGSPIVCTP